MDKQKTAVSWLFETMQSKLNNEMSVTFKEMFTEALAIEKEQIGTAFDDGYREHHIDGTEYYQTKYGEQS